MDGHFLNLFPVFSNKEERSIERLKTLYNDLNYLEFALKNLLTGFMDVSQIKDHSILIKPNWVYHDTRPNDPFCLRTHDNIIITLLNLLLKHGPSKVTIGDAPIQGAKWGGVCTDKFRNQIKLLSNHHNVPIIIRDYRKVIFDTKRNTINKDQNSLNEYKIFDLGEDSYLDPVTSENRKLFRVAYYDYRMLAEVHKKGVHKYCIINDIFTNDIIISIPKVKTHEKTGLTAALKNLVGVNGDKGYLPHHRLGGTSTGGDSYYGYNFIRSASEKCMDLAGINIGKKSFRIWQKLAIELWKNSHPKKEDRLMAGWYGNDTAWRMVIDINRIVLNGKADGTISNQPQRMLYSLCDGLIGGQGNGPLFPDPLPLGFLSFTNNAALNDMVFAGLMTLNYEKIPLIVNAFNLNPDSTDKVFLLGKPSKLEVINKMKILARPSPGWENFLNE